MKKKYKLLRGMITFIPDMSHGHYTFQFSMTDQLKPMALHKRWGISDHVYLYRLAMEHGYSIC